VHSDRSARRVRDVDDQVSCAPVRIAFNLGHRVDRRGREMVRVASSPPPQEVTFLSSEGQRMCDQGQTRGGILRLRRALMLMSHQGEGP